MRRPPVFLDRDGTLIVEKHYLCDPDEVELEQQATEGLLLLRKLSLPLVVVTNQSGIGRGMFDEDAAKTVNARVASLLQAQGVEIAGWYICPHAPDVPCQCRKPLGGLPRQAQKELGIELSGSFVIGDKRSDVEMADAIGGTGILVGTGHGAQSLAWARRSGRLHAPDLLAAARIIASKLVG